MSARSFGSEDPLSIEWGQDPRKGSRNFIFARNFTTNQPVDLKAYEQYFFSDELIRPLEHLSSEIKSLCYRNYEKRQSYVYKVVAEMSEYLGAPISPITSQEVHRRGLEGQQFDMFLPIGEKTNLNSPYVQILQNTYQTPHRVFSTFHKEYYSAHHKQNLRKCSTNSFHDFSPEYVPRTHSEKECYERLIHFLSNEIPQYEKSRTKIDPSSTSKLSPYFSLGIMSFEHLIEIVHCYLEPTPSHEEFERQCHWILFCKLKARNYIDKNLPPPLVPEQQEVFLQWMDGNLPEHNQVDRAVNAYMRALKEGRLISNRARLMITYYLVKVLGIDWRYGEFYFRVALPDSHPLVNFYNWEWQCNRNRFFSNYNLDRQLVLHGS